MTKAVVNPSRAVVVLGMHRSGTSVLTRALEAIGVYLGERLMPGLPDNPKGFYEDLDLTAINLALLADIGCGWDSLRIPSWQTLSEDQQSRYVERAVALIQQRFGTSSLWGFKDPRITRLLPFWLETLGKAEMQPIIVVANRHPLSVAASLARRDRMPKAQALALWALHQVSALEVLLNSGGLVVDYDQLIEQPLTQIARLQRFLESPVPDEDPNVREFVENFLERGLRHTEHDPQGRDLADSDLAKICQALYLHLRSWGLLEGNAPNALLENGAVLVKEVRDYFQQQMDWMEALDEQNSELHNLKYSLNNLKYSLKSWREKLWRERCYWENRYQESMIEIEQLRAQFKDAQSQLLHLTIDKYSS